MGLKSPAQAASSKIGRQGWWCIGTDRHKAVFVRGQKACVVAVAGYEEWEVEPDIDVYVYHSLGNLVAKDDDHTGQCFVFWIVRSTGKYTTW